MLSDSADRSRGHGSFSRQSLSRLAGSITFLIGLGVMLGALHFILEPTNPTEWKWKDYLARTNNSIQVINVGNSHAHCSMAPMQLWRDYGITSWNVTSGGINTFIKLAYVKEALQTQRPDVLLVEVHALNAGKVLPYTQNRDTFSFMPWSLTKVEAILGASAPGEWERLFVPLEGSHQLYGDITREDFGLADDNVRFSDGGAYVLDVPAGRKIIGDAQKSIPEVIDPEQAEVHLEWIKDIARECQRRDVRLVLWLAPVDGGYRDSADPLIWLSGRLEEDFSEIEYVNTNYHHEAIGLSPSDFRDQGHLYAWGMEKTTRWLAESFLLQRVRPTGQDNPDAGWWTVQAARWSPPTREEAMSRW